MVARWCFTERRHYSFDKYELNNRYETDCRTACRFTVALFVTSRCRYGRSAGAMPECLPRTELEGKRLHARFCTLPCPGT
eukprot:14702-Heterococcus_DN1.PRE.1